MAIGHAYPLQNWPSVRRFLPFDLDVLAVESQALERRRGVANGECLVRTLLLCGLPKATLESVSRSAMDMNLASLSVVALFKRLRKSETLLQRIFVHLLGHVIGPEARYAGYRLVAADATSLSGPGSKGTDQRLHVLYDLGKGLPVSVDLTDAHGAETLARHPLEPGDLVLTDRGYGWEASLLCPLRAGAHFLGRIEFDCLPLETDLGERILRAQAEGCVPESGPVDFCVYLPHWPAPLRAIGERIPGEGRIAWYLTDLGPDELPAQDAYMLYRKRWQVELFFKRLKSLLDLDELPSRDGPTARPWIWAKLTLCALVVLIGHERFSPLDRPTAKTEPMEGLSTFPNRSNVGPAPATAATTQARKAQKKRPPPKTQQTALPLAAVGALS